MKRLFKWFGAFALILIAMAVGPIGWVAGTCTDDPKQQVAAQWVTDAAHQREEAKTYLTYPEWHIVYAYEGVANVLKTADDHQFGFIDGVLGFWRSLCALNEEADRHGGSEEMSATVYTIGASFTLEMFFKAAYEETLGRLFAVLRGPEKSPQDIVAAEIAQEYAQFLQQTPWYEYDFMAAIERLWAAPVSGVRSWERRIALGIEWLAKAGYSRVIAGAVAAVGHDELTIRTVVADIPVIKLATLDGVTVIGTKEHGVEVQTARYRAFTRFIQTVAAEGGSILEIAGNDDILVTLLGPVAVPFESKVGARPLAQVSRMGFAESRVLVDVPVARLTQLISELPVTQFRLEHIHDY